MDIIEEHLKDSRGSDQEAEENSEEFFQALKQSDQLSIQRYSRHLVTPIRISENGTVGLQAGENEPLNAQELLIRPPWTPPPSPSLPSSDGVGLGLSVVGLASEDLICDGRR